MDDLERTIEEEMKDPEFRREWEKLAPEYQFREALIEARAKSGLTQKQLSDKMGVRQSMISRLESGQNMPTIDTLQKLSAALGIDFTISSNAIISNPHRAA